MSSTPAADGEAVEIRDPRILRRVTLSSLIGTAAEYYDYVLYGTMTALVFDRLFFSGVDPALASTAAFGTLAAGYVARPIGGIVFGHFGDRIGRKRMLIIAMALMGTASFLIGLLPTYEQAGPAAPLMLVTLRIMQGVALGGEWGGATLMVTEHAGANSRGTWNGIMQMGAPIGGMLSTAAVTAVTLLGDHALLTWAWRIPFLLSALVLVVGLYIRSGISESPVFTEGTSAAAAPKSRLPLADVLRHPRAVILACAIGIGPFALTALINTYMISYAKGIGYQLSSVITAGLVSAVVSLVTIPMFAALSDRVGRRPVILIGAIGIVLYAVPFYAMVDSLSAPRLIAAMVLAQALQSAMFAPLSTLFAEMFDRKTRYTGASLGYQLAAVVGGGFTPMIASSLMIDHIRSAPLVLIAIGCGMVTIIAILLIRETRGTDLTALPRPSAGATTERQPGP